MRRADPTRLYYVLEFLLSMPTWVAMAVYLVSVLHFSPLQLVLMGTAMEAAVFLCEVPTGVVADTYSRRLSLIVGYLGMGLAWMLVGVFSAAGRSSPSGRSGGSLTPSRAAPTRPGSRTRSASRRWVASSCGARGSATRARSSGSSCRSRLGVLSLRAAVIAGGAVTALCGVLCIFVMPETGFRRRPRAERGSPLAELRSTAGAGARYAWAAPVILLLVGVELFMGMSSEAFDRLKEAHFLRDVGLPAVGQLDPVVWFGIFWLAGMVLGLRRDRLAPQALRARRPEGR